MKVDHRRGPVDVVMAFVSFGYALMPERACIY